MSGLPIYWMAIVLMMVGLYTVIARDNLVKKIMGLNLFQVAVIMLYVSMGKIEEGTAPILVDGHLPEGFVNVSNPLPHVLMLTAIVVGVATTALGLALAVRIKEEYGTVEEDEMVTLDQALERGGG